MTLSQRLKWNRIISARLKLIHFIDEEHSPCLIPDSVIFRPLLAGMIDRKVPAGVSLWLGAIHRHCGWKWVDGAPFSFTRWSEGSVKV